MFGKIIGRIWNTVYSFFWCFKQPEMIKYDNEIEQGKSVDLELLNTTSNKLTIQIPKYEFILIED